MTEAVFMLLIMVSGPDGKLNTIEASYEMSAYNCIRGALEYNSGKHGPRIAVCYPLLKE